jgi:hypothetical protein
MNLFFKRAQKRKSSLEPMSKVENVHWRNWGKVAASSMQRHGLQIWGEEKMRWVLARNG